MGLFQQAVELFPYVFHPSTVLALGLVLIIHFEWDRQALGRDDLWKRLGAFLGAGVLAFVPTVAYFVFARGSLSEALQGSSWQLDMMVAAGVYIAAGTLWLVWRRLDWGALVPEVAEMLAAVMVPYAVLSPFWDISGHVIIALTPLLYLTLLDRRYWPLLSIPVLMVPNRVMVNAHTWPASIGGFVVAAAITLGLYRLQSPHEQRRETSSTPS